MCAAACASRGRPRHRRYCCFGRPPATDMALARHGAMSPQLAARRARARRRWLCRRPAAPPRRAWHTRPRRMARAASPRARPRSSRVLWHSMTPRVCFMCPARIHSSRDGLMLRARRVRPTPPRVRGERERHVCKSGAPSSKHSSDMAMVQLPCSDFVRLLPFVFRSTEDGQLCITRHGRATSRSPSVSSNEARIRRSEPRTAGRPSTWHGSRA